MSGLKALHEESSFNLPRPGFILLLKPNAVFSTFVLDTISVSVTKV